MLNTISALLLLGLLLWGGQPAHAQVDLKKLGQSTMNFLTVSVSPRSAGVADAYTSLSRGAESLFYNPAGIVDGGPNAADWDAFVGMTQWIADINYSAAAVTTNLGNAGALGISVLAVDYGDIEGAQLLSQSDPQGYRLTGAIENVGAYAVGLGYARQISSSFAMGGELRYVTHQLGTNDLGSGQTVQNNGSKVMANFGVRFYPGFRESFRFSMAIRNFSTGIEYEEVTAQMPVTFAVGAAINVLEVIRPDGSGNNSLMASAEFTHPNDYTERVNLGGVYTFRDLIALRAGYQFNHDLGGFAAGFGLTPEISGISLALDYAYSAMDVFEGVNRFSLGISF